MTIDNAIASGRDKYGFTVPNITAFFAEVLPNGAFKDTSYIPLESNTYCRTPIQLTKTNLFYYECARYSTDSRLTSPLGSSVYRINLNTLKYNIISICTYTSPTLSASCTEL